MRMWRRTLAVAILLAASPAAALADEWVIRAGNLQELQREMRERAARAAPARSAPTQPAAVSPAPPHSLPTTPEPPEAVSISVTVPAPSPRADATSPPSLPDAIRPASLDAAPPAAEAPAPPGAGQPGTMARAPQGAPPKLDLTTPERQPGEVLKASDFYVGVGGRAWISSGFTVFNFQAAGVNPLSELKWRGVDAIIPEVNVEVIWKRLVFMASAGLSDLDQGVLIDDDFLLSDRQGRFSHTRSRVTGDQISYVNGDIGFRLFSWRYSEDSAPGYIDVLAGYQYWREKYVAFGANGILDFFGVFDNVVDHSLKAITEEYTWQSARVGFRYHVPGPGGIGFKTRVFFLPYTSGTMKDVHHLRDDLKKNPSVATRAEGGYGYQLEAGLTWSPWSWLTIEGGYQYWNVNPGEGVITTYSLSGTFHNKLNEIKIERYGPYILVQGRF